jgi:hypothetical protein
LKEKNNWEKVYQLITERNFQLIHTWYSELRIKDLLPNKQVDKFNITLNNNYWSNNFVVNNNRELTKFLKESLTSESSKTWITKPFDIEGNKLHFYLIVDKYSNKMLESNGIAFGIMRSIDSIESSIFNIDETFIKIYYSDQKSYSEGLFTLSAHENESYILLINKIHSWLRKYPVVNYQLKLTNHFLNTIKSSFKSNFS